MSQSTTVGLVAGSVIGFAGAVSPVGDIPSLLFLKMQGVMNPERCLNWIKDGQGALQGVSLPCFPLTDPASLSLLSGILVFIAIGLLIWKGSEILGQLH